MITIFVFLLLLNIASQLFEFDVHVAFSAWLILFAIIKDIIEAVIRQQNING